MGSLDVFALHLVGTPPPSSPAPSGDISQLPLRPEETWVEFLAPERLQLRSSGLHCNGLTEGFLLISTLITRKGATVTVSLPQVARKWQAGPEPLVLTILSPRVAVPREVFMGCLYVYWSVPVFMGMFIFRGVYVRCVACPRLGERFVPFPDAFQPGLPPLAAGLQVLAVSCRRHGAENEPLARSPSAWIQWPSPRFCLALHSCVAAGARSPHRPLPLPPRPARAAPSSARPFACRLLSVSFPTDVSKNFF